MSLDIKEVIDYIIDFYKNNNGKIRDKIEKKDFKIINLPDFNTIFPSKQTIESETIKSLLDSLENKEIIEEKEISSFDKVEEEKSTILNKKIRLRRKS